MSNGRRLIGGNLFKNPARYFKKNLDKVSTPFKNRGAIFNCSIAHCLLTHPIKGSKVKVTKLAEL